MASGATSSRLCTAFKAASFCGLFAFLLYKAHAQVAKYAVGKTTVAKHLEHHDTLEFPAVSVCPGYKRDAIARLKWPIFHFKVLGKGVNETLAREAYPKTKEDLLAQWETINYDIGEIFAEMPEEADVIRRDTLMGRCYTVLGRHPTTLSSDSLLLSLRHADETKAKLFVHDRAAAIGLNALHWTSNMSVTAVTVDCGGVVDVSVAKAVFVRGIEEASEDEVAAEEVEADDYHAAVNAWFDGEFRKMADSVCWIPGYGSMVSEETMAASKPCTDFDSFKRSLQFFHLILRTHNNATATGIAQPREIPRYRVTTRTGVAVGEDANLFFFYESTMVAVEEEYVLMDFNGLVASIGGWLGILVGLSFYGIVQLAADLAAATDCDRMCDRGDGGRRKFDLSV